MPQFLLYLRMCILGWSRYGVQPREIPYSTLRTYSRHILDYVIALRFLITYMYEERQKSTLSTGLGRVARVRSGLHGLHVLLCSLACSNLGATEIATEHPAIDQPESKSAEEEDWITVENAHHERLLSALEPILVAPRVSVPRRRAERHSGTVSPLKDVV